MIRRISAVFVFLLLAVSFTPRVVAVDGQETSGVVDWGITLAGDEVEFVPGEMIVGAKGISEPLLTHIRNRGGGILEVIPSLKAVRVSVPAAIEAVFVTAMRSHSEVRYIERNFIVKAVHTPTDPYWSYQWNMRAIYADSAWDIHEGSTGIVVAIVDTGIQYTHPDLSANYVAQGYDWVNGDSDPMDDNGHGTHVAGITAAVMDNSIGVAGVAQISLMAEKVLDSSGSGTATSVAQGVVDAADKGAEVVSLSLGMYSDSTTVRDACEYAWGKGSVLVAAAGNDNTGSKFYPAAYDTVISVAATNTLDGKASYSNYGNWIELSAPGGDGNIHAHPEESILSTYITSGYAWAQGTSMAAPHVSGLAALIWSHSPSLTGPQVREHLDNTADDLGDPGKDQYFGYGRINAYRALSEPLKWPAGSDLTGSSTSIVLGGNRFDIDTTNSQRAVWTGGVSAAGLMGGDDTVLAFGMKLLQPGFNVAGMVSGDQYEIYFNTTDSGSQFAFLFQATAASMGVMKMFKYTAGGWSNIYTLNPGVSLHTGTTYSDADIGFVLYDSYVDPRDGEIRFYVAKSFLAQKGGGGTVISIYARTASDASGSIGSGTLRDRCPYPSGTATYATGSPIPEFPLGLLLLAIPVSTIYYLSRRRANMGVSAVKGR